MNAIKVIKRELLSCLDTLVSPLYVLIIIAMIIAANNLGSSTYMELLLNSFSGIIAVNGNPMMTIIWIAHQVCIIYFVCNYFSIELEDRYVYTITRFKSKAKWLLTRIVHITILIFVYYTFLFLLIFLSGRLKFGSSISVGGYASEYLVYTGYIHMSPIKVVINIIILIILTTLLISIFQVIVTLLSRNSILSITASLVLIVVSISGNIISTKLDKYLPANQAIFLKHNFYDFNFTFSYIYLVISLLLLLCFSYYCVKKVEI